MEKNSPDRPANEQGNDDIETNVTSWTLKKNLERRSRNRQCNNTIIIIFFLNRLRATRTDGRPRSVTFSGRTGAFHQQRSSCTCGVDSYLPNTTRSYRANNHCVTQHETRDRRTRQRRVRHTTPPHQPYVTLKLSALSSSAATADRCSSTRRRRRLRCRSHVFRVSTNYVANSPRSGACARAFHSYARTHEARFFAAAKPQKNLNTILKRAGREWAILARK